MAIQDGVADVAKSVGSLLQLRGVSLDGKVTLRQGGELLVHDDGARLLVRLEQITDGRVEGTGSLIWCHGESRTPSETEPYI